MAGACDCAMDHPAFDEPTGATKPLQEARATDCALDADQRRAIAGTAYSARLTWPPPRAFDPASFAPVNRIKRVRESVPRPVRQSGATTLRGAGSPAALRRRLGLARHGTAARGNGQIKPQEPRAPREPMQRRESFSTHWWASVGDCDTEQCEAAVAGSAFSRSALARLACKIALGARLRRVVTVQRTRP